jgi:hypothetical protein
MSSKDFEYEVHQVGPIDAESQNISFLGLGGCMTQIYKLPVPVPARDRQR